MVRLNDTSVRAVRQPWSRASDLSLHQTASDISGRRWGQSISEFPLNGAGTHAACTMDQQVKLAQTATKQICSGRRPGDCACSLWESLGCTSPLAKLRLGQHFSST